MHLSREDTVHPELANLDLQGYVAYTCSKQESYGAQQSLNNAKQNPMSAILWTRVDDRLIHGQITVGWRQYLHFEEIWVVDDLTAADPPLAQVLSLAAPADVRVRVYTAQEAVAALRASHASQVLLLVKAPQTALDLVRGGAPIAQLNVGNVAAAPGRQRVFQSISLGPAHMAALDELSALGVRITFQQAPEDRTADWQTIRKNVRRGR